MWYSCVSTPTECACALRSRATKHAYLCSVAGRKRLCPRIVAALLTALLLLAAIAAVALLLLALALALALLVRTVFPIITHDELLPG